MTATPRSGTGLIVLMAYLMGMGQLAVSLYLPSLPQIADDFLARDGTVQLTFTLFILAFAVAQLVVGPMSDHFGRVVVLKAGLVVFTLASLVCLIAPTVDILIAARVVQAIGACVAPTLSRAIVRDLYEGEKSARVLAAIGMVMAIAPAFGPTVGGFIAVGFGWRTVFGVLTALGLFSYALVYLSLDETLPPERRRKLRLGRTLGRYVSLTADRRFLAPGLVVGLGMGGLGAYLAGAPFVFIRLLDIPPYVFGMFSMLNVGSFALGSAIASRLTGRLFDLRDMTVIGAAICAAGGVLLVVSMAAGLFSVAGILAPMVVYFVGMGLALPNAMAEAINRYPDDAGLASALLGFLQFGGWAVASFAVAAWGTGNPMPLATVVCAVAVGTLAAALSIVRRTERAS